MVFILVVKIMLVCLHATTYLSIINTNRYRKSRTDNVRIQGEKMQKESYLSAARTNICLPRFSRIQVTNL